MSGRETAVGGHRRPRRAQLSLSAVEMAVGVLFVLGVAGGFAVGLPDPGGREAQLNGYARDAATLLADEPPMGDGETRLSAAAGSPAGFERERVALAERLETLLPDSVAFRLRTPQGAVGYPLPSADPVGRTTVSTLRGDVSLWVWYV